MDAVSASFNEIDEMIVFLLYFISHLKLARMTVPFQQSVTIKLLVAILADIFLNKNLAETCSQTQWNKQVYIYIYIYCFVFLDLTKCQVIQCI